MHPTTYWKKCCGSCRYELGVFDVAVGGLNVVELAPSISLDDVLAVTEAKILN